MAVISVKLPESSSLDYRLNLTEVGNKLRTSGYA